MAVCCMQTVYHKMFEMSNVRSKKIHIFLYVED